MPDGGELRIKTRNSKRAVYIDISDTGAGMPEESLGRIFDPFFTINKDKGIGLGLSISYGIIKTHNGELLVKSKEKEGSTFTIKLPAEK
jgi:two-component system NtrC family sensor kinase